MTTENKCARCGGRMEEGFIFDRGDGGYKQQQTWVEGEAEESFWANGLRTSGRRTYGVRADRCAGCGYLEFYTTENVNLGYFS